MIDFETFGWLTIYEEGIASDSFAELRKLLHPVVFDSWDLGDVKNKRTGARYTSSGVQIKSRLSENTVELQSHVEDVLAQVAAYWDHLIAASGGTHFEMYVGARVYRLRRPIVHFASKILQRVAQINADIDIDVSEYAEPLFEDGACLRCGFSSERS